MPLNLDDELLIYRPSSFTRANIIAETPHTIDCSGVVPFNFDISDDYKEAFERALLIDRYTPKKIIYNGPATIVFWTDGTKTIVKRSKKDKDNKYNAFCAALAKKIFGSNNKIINIVKNGKEE